MTRLEEITKRLFGDDADRLLQAHAIIPLIDQSKPKAGMVGWRDGFDPAREVQFHSLGLLVGERSGITVWDADTHDLTPPVDPNVKTAKGWHIYTPHQNESRAIKPVAGLDVLGNRGFAIFYGRNKEFLHPRLADSKVMTDWFNTLDQKSPPIPSRDIEQSHRAESKSRVIEQSYCEFLETQGYVLDHESVRNQYVKTMGSVEEGSRNVTLYRYTREMARCGLDLSDLHKAAIDSGLDPSEIDSAMLNAEMSVILDPHKSVYDRVNFWMDNAIPLVPSVAHGVMDELARRAIETNNLAPFFPQQDLADRLAVRGLKRDRSWVSKVLTNLDAKWQVIRVVPLGHQPDGKRNPNAYRLTLAGQPISEIDR